MEDKYLTEEDKKRMKMLVNEIYDFLNAIRNEIYNDKAYKSYLKEKMDAVNTDINCINSLLEK